MSSNHRRGYSNNRGGYRGNHDNKPNSNNNSNNNSNRNHKFNKDNAEQKQNYKPRRRDNDGDASRYTNKANMNNKQKYDQMMGRTYVKNGTKHIPTLVEFNIDAPRVYSWVVERCVEKDYQRIIDFDDAIKYTRHAIMKIGKYEQHEVDKDLVKSIETISPERDDLTLVEVKKDCGFDSSKWLPIYCAAIDGFREGVVNNLLTNRLSLYSNDMLTSNTDGEESISISEDDSSTFKLAFTTLIRLFITVRMVEVSLHRTYLQNKYPEYFDDHSIGKIGNKELDAEQKEERDKVRKEYESLKDSNVYTVVDTYRELTNDCFNFNLKKVREAWKCMLFDPYLFTNIVSSDFGINNNYLNFSCHKEHLSNVSDLRTFVTHIRSIRSMFYNLNDIEDCMKVSASVCNLKAFGDDVTDKDKYDKLSFNRTAIYITSIMSTMFDVYRDGFGNIDHKNICIKETKPSDNGFSNWTTSISLIHDTFIKLHFNIDLLGDYSQFSNEGRIIKQVTYPRQYFDSEITSIINKLKPRQCESDISRLYTFNPAAIIMNALDTIKTQNDMDSVICRSYSINATNAIIFIKYFWNDLTIDEKYYIIDSYIGNQVSLKYNALTFVIWVTALLNAIEGGLVDMQAAVERRINNEKHVLLRSSSDSSIDENENEKIVVNEQTVIELFKQYFDTIISQYDGGKFISILESLLILCKSCYYAKFEPALLKQVWNMFKAYVNVKIEEKVLSMTMIWKLDGLEKEYEELPPLPDRV